jgi:glycosyltransferase involved in cell wall biosynthesis
MKPRVLMIAYACVPSGGGEHWLGWGWAQEAAKNFDVTLVTTPRAQAEVEQAALSAGITPYFVDVSAKFRKFTERTGANWFRKLSWQRKVLKLARRLHEEKPFAVAHQTTFHTFRVPFLAAQLGIPSVWGPIAGGEHVPPGFEEYLGSARSNERNRNFFNRLCLGMPSVGRSLEMASTLFVSNHTTLTFLPAALRGKSIIVAPNSLRPEDEDRPASVSRIGRGSERRFNLLYVGNCVATRAIPLVFDALLKSGLTDYEFFIVGDGPALGGWKELARLPGLETRVRFVGKVPHAQLDAYYEAADALVFPALRDSGGSALLEAMARSVPVVCLDWGGPGEMVDEQSGIKIPVHNPRETMAKIGEALLRLKNDPALGPKLAKAARERARSMFRWEAKRELLESTYRLLIRP